MFVCINSLLYLKRIYLPAATKLGQGNIFTSVCQEFYPQGEGGGGLPQCMLGYITPWSRQTPHPPTRHTPPRADTPADQAHPPGPGTPPDQTHPPDQTPHRSRHPREADCSIRSTSGRYSSYWNAFLSTIGFFYFLSKGK